MNRTASVFAALAIIAAGAGAVPTATADPIGDLHGHANGHSRSHSYTPPPLIWGPCADEQLQDIGARCSMLTVPLDYDKPGGKKIQLAVSRLRHTSPDRKFQGVMLVNPGGPGGSGLSLSVLGIGDFIPGNADLQYDWIGFDPRGVGSSVPALACDGQYFGYDRPNYVPITPEIEQAWLDRSRGYANDCAGRPAAEVLDHLKTTDNVADMESLRKALGRHKINYYGFSYGTYLGQVYATEHPNRVRRMVMDGVVNPKRVWYDANLDQDVGFQKTIEAFFTWLSEHDDVFHLGTDGALVERKYFAELDKLDATPAAGVIGPDELTDVMINAGYGVFGWEDIGHAYASLLNHGDVAGIKEMYDEANPQTDGSDNLFAVYLGTICTDARWPRSLDRINADNARVNERAPFMTWANAWFNGPCSFWAGENHKAVKVRGDKVRPNVLLLSETLDAATPFSGALRV